MEDGRCLLDVINDLESVLSELDPQPAWNSENNQNGDPSALDEFFQHSANDQVAAVASEDGELWSPTASAGGGMEGQDAGNVVYQDPLAEAMASITAPSSSPSSPQLLPHMQTSSSGVLEHSSQISIDEVQYETQLASSSQLVVSSSAPIPSQVLHYAAQPHFTADNSIVSSTSPARVLTPQPAQSPIMPSSRTESPLVRQVVTPTGVGQQGQQIQLSQSQLNFLLSQQQQQGGQAQQTMTFASQSQPVASGAQGVQTQSNILPIVNRQIGNVQIRPQGVVPGTTLQGAIIQTSSGQRILIQQPMMPGQQINLAQLQQQIQSSGGGVVQLQNPNGQAIQLQGTPQPAAQVQNQLQPTIQLHQSGTSTPVAQSPAPVAQPLQIQQQPQSGASTPLAQQAYQIPIQQTVQQVQGSSTGQVAGKPQSNMSIISVNTPQGPQQFLIQRANGPQNQNVILGALPPNVIQIQTSGANQPAQVVVAQPGHLQSGVAQSPILNSNGQASIGQPHVLGNVNLVNSAQNVNINMVLPAGQNLQSLQAAQQALQLQGQQIVNIMNSQGQTLQVAKNAFGQNLKLNVGGQQVPISLQQLKQLQGIGLAQQQQQQQVIASSVSGNFNTSQVTTSTSVASTGANAVLKNQQLQQQQLQQLQQLQQHQQHQPIGSQHHPIIIGSSTPPSSQTVSSSSVGTSCMTSVSLPSTHISQVSSVASVPQVVSSNYSTSHTSSSLTQSGGQVVYNVPQVPSSSFSASNFVPSQPSISSSVAQIPQTVPVQNVISNQLAAVSDSIPSVSIHQEEDYTIPTNSTLPVQRTTVAGYPPATFSQPVIANQSVLQAPPNVNIQNITKISMSNTNVIPSTVQVVPKVIGAQGGSAVQQAVAPSQTVPQAAPQQLVGPKPVIVQNSPVFRMSPQNQEMMRQLQANIAKLQKLPNRTEKHESLLRQLKEVLQKLLQRARLDAIQQQQQQAQQVVQVKTGQTFAVPSIQGQIKANVAQQNLTVVTPANQTNVVQTVPSNQQLNTTNKGLKTPVSATVTLATATTNIPLLAPGQQIKTLKSGPMLQIIPRHNHRQLQIPQALQEKLAKLTPEQQQLFLKTQGPLLVKLHQEQQARLQQQQIQQGKVPITVQPIGTQLKPLLATGITVVQKPQPLTKATIISQQLQRDQKEATHPDFKTPFKNVKDACKRLIRYHVFQSSEPSDEDFDNDAALFEEVAEGLLERKQRMFDKFRSLLYAEATRPQPLSEMAMLEKMFIQSEKELLENDKKLAKESPDLFKPCPYIVKEENEPVTVKKEPASEMEVTPEGTKRKSAVVISDSEEEGPSPEKLQKNSSDNSLYTARQGGGLKMVFKTSPKHPDVKQEPDLAANYDLKPFSIKLEPLPDYKALSSNLLGSQVKLERGDLEIVLSSKNHEVMFTDDEDEDEEDGKAGGSQNSLFAFSGGGAEEESNVSQSQDNSLAQEADDEEESSETDAAVSGLLNGSPWSGKHSTLPFRSSERDPLGLEVSQDSEFDSAVSNLEDSQLGHMGMARRTSSNVDKMFGSDDENDCPENNLKVEVESAINSILSLQGSELGIGEDQGLEDPVDGSHMDPYLASQESDSQDDLEAAVNSILY